MGYLIKSSVINAIHEDMQDTLDSCDNKMSSELVKFIYKCVEEKIDELPQYRLDNVVCDECEERVDFARSNVWDWFVTLTLAPAKMDRYNLPVIFKKVCEWFDDLCNRVSPEMYYLIVPEQHKDGAWHFHGLLGTCDGLSFVDSGLTDKEDRMIYIFENWKYGFSTATRVTDSAKASSYICGKFLEFVNQIMI